MTSHAQSTTTLITSAATRPAHEAQDTVDTPSSSAGPAKWTRKERKEESGVKHDAHNDVTSAYLADDDERGPEAEERKWETGAVAG
jgi:hypothetical protein